MMAKERFAVDKYQDVCTAALVQRPDHHNRGDGNLS